MFCFFGFFFSEFTDLSPIYSCLSISLILSLTMVGLRSEGKHGGWSQTELGSNPGLPPMVSPGTSYLISLDLSLLVGKMELKYFPQLF